MGIVAILVGLLLPALIYARGVSHTALCAGNLKQTGAAWQLYLQEHRVFPRYTDRPDWNYGGVTFVGIDRRPVLASDRPLNRYLYEEGESADHGRFSLLFRCPGDTGVFLRTGSLSNRPGARTSVLGDRSCFQFFGTSYRANPNLLDSTRAGIDDLRRPLGEQEIYVDASRLLLAADAGWYYATRAPGQPGSNLDASWHGKPGGGNMLAADGSVRFEIFGGATGGDYELYPRPGMGD